jgi:hypothetical protein
VCVVEQVREAGELQGLSVGMMGVLLVWRSWPHFQAVHGQGEDFQQNSTGAVPFIYKESYCV